MAKLIYYYGAMNAGKSLSLLAFAAKLRNKNIPYTILKPSTDTRDGAFISSRPLNEKLPCWLWGPKEQPLNSLIDGAKYILVDEAQFLNENQVMQLVEYVDEKNIDVICYGLRTDFQTRLFEGSKRLFELADELHEIDDIDAEGNKVIINARIKDGEIVLAGPQVEVGAEDKYQSMSRKEFYKRLDNKEVRQEYKEDIEFEIKEEKHIIKEKYEYILEGIAIPFGEVSSNGRFYTKDSFITKDGKNVLDEFIEQVKKDKVFGTLGQDERNYNIENFSHQIVGVEMRDDGIYVALRVLNTPKGSLVKSLIDSNLSLCATQRAYGEVDTTRMCHIDNIVSYDLTTQPIFIQRGKPVIVTRFRTYLEMIKYVQARYKIYALRNN